MSPRVQPFHKSAPRRSTWVVLVICAGALVPITSCNAGTDAVVESSDPNNPVVDPAPRRDGPSESGPASNLEEAIAAALEELTPELILDVRCDGSDIARSECDVISQGPDGVPSTQHYEVDVGVDGVFSATGNVRSFFWCCVDDVNAPSGSIQAR